MEPTSNYDTFTIVMAAVFIATIFGLLISLLILQRNEARSEQS